MKTLFTSIQFGKIELKNRIVMAPMTRCRAIHNIPNSLMADHYGQRADAGLLITEGTSPSPNGLGYARIPGLFSQEHVNGWKLVTDAVHKKGGKIFVQLMHTGRVSHPLNMKPGTTILAPSVTTAPGEMWTDQQGQQPFPAAQEMTELDIQTAINEFRHSAKLAIQAGFDGVELHGANGYLIDQFLNTATNHRKDRWGGSLENRIRFAVEVAKNVAQEIGPERLGMRISPYGVFNGMIPDSQMDELYLNLCKELNSLKLCYIHVVDHSSMGTPPVSAVLKSKIRKSFQGRYILSGGYTAETANHDLDENRGDLVAFGRPFIANPDLVKKLENNLPLTAPDMATFYTGDAKGYTDY